MNFNDFKGNGRIKKVLKLLVNDSQATGKQYPHTLLTGPAGTGKTTLAKIIAHELGARIIEISGATLTNEQQVISLLANLHRNDILFIDEIHQVKPNIQGALLKPLEQRHLSFFIDFENEQYLIEKELPPFTLIAATTDQDKLLDALLSRFKVSEHLEDYTASDIKAIAKAQAESHNITLNDNTLELVSDRARFNPRQAVRIIELLQRLGSPKPTAKEARRIINDYLALHIHGLTNNDIKYLDYTKDTPKSLNNISAKLNQTRSITTQQERHLIRLDLITTTPRGRLTTDKGINLLANIYKP